MNQDTMDLKQFETALKLAAAYGHEWANVQEVRYLLKSDALAPTFALIEAIMASREKRAKESPRYMQMPEGIRCPKLDMDYGDHDAIGHRSGTGRVQWHVHRGGSAKIEICRPSGTVIEIFVPAEPYVSPTVLQRGEVCERHIIEARIALAALVGAERAEKTLSDVTVTPEPIAA